MKELSIIKDLFKINELITIIKYIDNNFNSIKSNINSFNNKIRLDNKIFNVSIFSVNINNELYFYFENKEMYIKLLIGDKIENSDNRVIKFTIKNLRDKKIIKNKEFEEINYEQSYNNNTLKLQLFNFDIKDNEIIYYPQINIEFYRYITSYNINYEIYIKNGNHVINYTGNGKDILNKKLINYLKELFKNKENDINNDFNNVEIFTQTKKNENKLYSLLEKIKNNEKYNFFLETVFDKKNIEAMLNNENYKIVGTDFFNKKTENIFYKKNYSNIKRLLNSISDEFSLYINYNNILYEIKENEIILKNKNTINNIPIQIEKINFEEDLKYTFKAIPEFRLDFQDYSKIKFEDFLNDKISDFSISRYLNSILNKIELKSLNLEDIFQKEIEVKFDLLYLETDVNIKQKINKAFRDIEKEYTININEDDNKNILNKKI